MNKTRIEILDGFRALAILAVVFYHFFTRWTPPYYTNSLYPYGSQFDYFYYGYLGVHFFFAISGFVIFFTLEQTEQFYSFWKKRFIRLFPSILVATIITYVVCCIWDTTFLFPSAHELKNFLPSLTFITPAIFNLLSDVEFKYINGAYWSLWPEVQFYLFISAFYYLSKKNVVRNFVMSAAILIIVNDLYANIQGSNKLNIALPDAILDFYDLWVKNIFNLPDYLPFFCLGVLMYLLYKNKQLQRTTSIWIKLSTLFFVAYLLYSAEDMNVRITCALMIILFFCFVFFPTKIKFFENRLLVRIGRSSYFLYLIHECIGLLLIYNLASDSMPVGVVFTFALVYILILISIFFTEKIDYPMSIFLKRILLSKKIR